MKKAVILGSGLATRLYPITKHIPKVLVNYKQHTILKHLYDLYERLGAEEIILVVHSKFKETVNEYAHMNGFSESFKVVTVDEAYGSAYAISQIPDIKGHNVIFNWCDVIPKFKAGFKWDQDTIYTFGDQCRYSFVGNLIHEVGSTGGNVVGIYQSKSFDIKQFYDKEHANEYYRGRDYIEILGPRVTHTRQDLIELVDLGDMEKLRAAHADGQVIAREFNDVQITENMVYKYARNQRGIDLQAKELRWYQEVESDNVPMIYNSRTSSDSRLPMFSMERIKGKTIFEYSKTHPINNKLIDKILDSMVFKKDTYRVLPVEEFQRDMKYEIIDKVLDRCESIEGLIHSFSDFGHLQEINGVKLGRLKPMLKKAYAHLIHCVDHNYSVIHGDPNFSNTLIDDQENIKFIDPRGYFGSTQLYGPKDYDECKVLYALSGYDKFNSDPTWGSFAIDPNGLSANIVIDPVSSYEDVDQFEDYHYLWVAVIWIALGGYFKNNPLKAVAAYYYGMYLLTVQLEKMGRRLTDGSVVHDERLTHARLKTKCPDKWLLIDRETGERYKPATSGRFDWEKL